MICTITVANGEWKKEVTVIEVHEVKVEDGAYILFDAAGNFLFSSPFDSTICVELA